MVKKIAVLRAGALGDAVLTLPLFKALRLKFPDSRVISIGSSSLVSLLKDSPLADEIYSLDDGAFSSFFTKSPLPEEWRSRLRDTDIAYNLIDDETLSNNMRFAGADVVRSVSLTVSDRHLSDKILSVMKDDLPEDSSLMPELFLSDKDIEFAREFFASNDLDGPVLAIHPGSGSSQKNWSASNFAKVADVLSQEYKVVLIEGEADGEAVKEFLNHYSKARIIILREARVRQLAAFLRRSSLYIGNDSGVSHLAAAAGTPSVCVFGPTDPAIWAPRGQNVVTVSKHAPCAPCSREEREGCNNSPECLKIEPEAVLRAVRRVLD